MEQDYKKENRNSFWYIFGYVGRISRSSFNKALAFYILCIIVLVGLKYISLQNPVSDTSIAIGYFLSIARVFLFLKSASNLNGNLNCSKELEHYAS